MADRYDLQKFLDAQNRVEDAVTRELSAGRKQTHWMWFVFPQMRGLGHSTTALHYGIGSLDEARSFLDHPVLGPRLRRWTEIVLGVQGRSAEQIFGYPDYLKFHSSMTLFDAADDSGSEASVFHRAIEKYYAGAPDDATLRLFGRR